MTQQILICLRQKLTGQKKEIDSLIFACDHIVLNNTSSPQNIVELIAGINEYKQIKLPYYQKLAYFEKKYHSEIIRKYLEFCSK